MQYRTGCPNNNCLNSPARPIQATSVLPDRHLGLSNILYVLYTKMGRTPSKCFFLGRPVHIISLLPCSTLQPFSAGSAWEKGKFMAVWVREEISLGPQLFQCPFFSNEFRETLLPPRGKKLAFLSSSHGNSDTPCCYSFPSPLSHVMRYCKRGKKYSQVLLYAVTSDLVRTYQTWTWSEAFSYTNFFYF